MAWLAVDKDGSEHICSTEPYRDIEDLWCIENTPESEIVRLPKGSIEKLIGRKLTWNDTPVELKDKQYIYIKNCNQPNNMQVEISAMIEDYDILTYVSEKEQAKVIDHIFYECTEESRRTFIHILENSYLVDELEARGYTITKNEK